MRSLWNDLFFRRVALLTLLAAVSPLSLNAQSPEPQVGLINRDAAVYNQASGKVYILDATHSAVSIIPPSGPALSVKVGSSPVSIGVNNRTGMVYVVNSGSHSVSVLDGKTDSVIATVPTPARSYAVAVDEAANKVYVSNIFSNMLTIIDGTTNTAINAPAGSADAIIVDNDRNRVYLLHYESDILTEFDPATGATTKIAAGAMHQWGFLRAGKTLYVTHVQDANVAAIDLETRAIRTLPTGSMPCAIAVNTKTGQLYVASYVAGTITIFDNDTFTATVTVAPHPQAIAVDPDKGLLYAASPQQSAVTVIDIRSHRVLKTLKSADQPYAITVNPITHVAYSANLGNTPFTSLGKP